MTTKVQSNADGSSSILNGAVEALHIATDGKVAFPQGISGPAELVSLATFVGNGGVGPCTIDVQENVSGVQKTGVGSYTITFATPLPDANYAVFITLSAAGPALVGLIVSGNASSFSVATYTVGPTELNDNARISVLAVRKTP